VLYERIIAMESANHSRRLWNGGMDEETARKAIEEITQLKMAEAA
jgi:hypothetical protein